MAVGLDGIGHKDHHIERCHVAGAHGVTVDSLENGRRQLGKQLRKFIGGNRAMQKWRRGGRRAGNLDAIVQRAGHELVVGEYLIPVMNQAGGGGIKTVNAVDLGQMKRGLGNPERMHVALTFILHTHIEQLLNALEQRALIALKLILYRQRRPPSLKIFLAQISI